MYQNFSLSKQRSYILQIPLRINNNDKFERRQCPDQPLRISEPVQFCPRSPELAASSELALGPVIKEAELLHHGGVLQGPPQRWRPRAPASPPGLLTALPPPQRPVCRSREDKQLKARRDLHISALIVADSTRNEEISSPVEYLW